MLRRLLQQASNSPRFILRQSSSPLLNKCYLFSSSSSSSQSQFPNSSFIEQLEDKPDATTISIDRSGLCNPRGIIHFRVCKHVSIYLFVIWINLLISLFNCFLVWFENVEHSHEATSDSELVKHLKGIIKVNYERICIFCEMKLICLECCIMFLRILSRDE